VCGNIYVDLCIFYIFCFCFFSFREFINSLRLHRSFYGGLADGGHSEKVNPGYIASLPCFLSLELEWMLTVVTLQHRLG